MYFTRSKAFTLLEVIVSLVILSTILTLILMYQHSSNNIINETKLNGMVSEQLALGLEEMTRELQMADRIVLAKENKIVFDSPKIYHSGGRIIKKNRLVTYSLGLFKQTMSNGYELPVYGLMRIEDGNAQPICYYFGSNVKDLKFLYYNDDDTPFYDENINDLPTHIQIEISTTTKKAKQKLTYDIIVTPLKERG